MKVRILHKNKNELKIEIGGESHTFCNVVQKALLEDKRVDLAGYDIPHPLTAHPVLYLRTRTRSKPEIVLRDAVNEIHKNTKTFRIAFEKAIKGWKASKVSVT